MTSYDWLSLKAFQYTNICKIQKRSHVIKETFKICRVFQDKLLYTKVKIKIVDDILQQRISYLKQLCKVIV